MEFKEVVNRRRSIRKFLKDCVAEESLLSIVEAGRWAPSAGNCQPWRFIIVTDPETKKAIAQNCTKFSKEHWMQFSPERAKYLAARGGSWDKSSMKDIPILIVVSYRLQESVRNELVEILHGSKMDRIACMIQLGQKKNEPISPSRKRIDEIVSHEHF